MGCKETNLKKFEGNAKVVGYVLAEVRRQGHYFFRHDDAAGILVHDSDGVDRVLWMLDAWSYARALPAHFEGNRLEKTHMEEIGKRVEIERNEGGFRDNAVFVGGQEGSKVENLHEELDTLLAKQGDLTPEEFYRAFQGIHPFFDGNGRTGKIVLNWLNGTMDEPVMPPNFFNCSNP